MNWILIAIWMIAWAVIAWLSKKPERRAMQDTGKKPERRAMQDTGKKPPSASGAGSSGVTMAAGGSGGGGGSGGAGSSSFSMAGSGRVQQIVSPRASGAGMPGFGEQEFEFAAGVVRGVRNWSMPAPPFHLNPHAAGNWSPRGLRGAAGHRWTSGVLEAACMHDIRHRPPVEFDPLSGTACGCGIWAYWNMSYAPKAAKTSAETVPVAGIIEGTGRIISGDRGFRCQRAVIVALAPAFIVRAEHTGFLSPDADLLEAQARADAWLGVIQVRLEIMYPHVKVFATVPGMLASIRTGEISS
jgi:hypothetical protein